MVVMRTLALRLVMVDEDKQRLLDTMREYTKAFNASAEWGFANKEWNKVENHKATYRTIRAASKLNSSLVQCARDTACEALKALKCETLPKRKPLAAMRLNHNVVRINLLHGLASLSATVGRVKAAFNTPEHYRQYLDWNIRGSTLSYRDGPDFLCRSCGLHVHSDLNASRNIAHAGIAGMGGPPVNRPNAMPSVAVASHSPLERGS
jgi:predicted transposase